MMLTNKVIIHICAVVVVGMFALGLAGCEQKHEESAEAFEHETNVTSKADNEQFETIDVKDTSVTMPEKKLEMPQKDASGIYSAATEWQNVTNRDFSVQIDDVYIQVGDSVDILVKRLEASAEDFSYEIDLQKMVEEDDGGILTISKNGEEWIEIWYCNLRDGDKPTKECFVFGILPSRQAIKSSRVFDGRSYSDILNMTYSDLQMLLEFYDIQDVKEITYDFGTYTRTDFYYYYESKSSDDLFGYRVGIAYEFLIYTKKDDRIIDFEIKERGDLWLEHDANVWTLSDLDSEEVLNTIQEESRYMQDSIEGYIFATYNEDSRSGYDTVLFCITRTAGFPYNEEGYVVHEIEQPANTVDGFDADYSMIDIYGDIYKTLPEAIEFAESRMEDCSVVWSTFTP